MSRTALSRPGVRLAAGTLALVLPLVAAAGCGVVKKRTIKEEFAAAQSHLAGSSSVSVTLHVDDAKGSLAKLMAEDGSTPKSMVTALLKGSVTITADEKSLRALRCSTGAAASLQSVALSVAVRDDRAAVAELRLVKGNLYAHIGLTEIGRLATAAGVKDFDGMLDDNLGGVGSPFAQGLADVRAGKWLELPLTKYLDELKQLAGSIRPELAPKSDYCAQVRSLKALEGRVIATVKPFVKITDANNSSSNRVLDVKVRVRPAAKALVALLKAQKGLPFGMMLSDATPPDVDVAIKDGTARGTITLKSGHLRQVTVDLESVRTLATDPSVNSLDGTRLIVDVDDAAAPVTAPTDVSTFDLGKLIQSFLQGFADHVSSVSSSSAVLTAP